ncbi:MAG: hypothetical protein TREMPRED_001738 [Tremellales sp. Tagirdzhanova-0007]|nr:MAG: hypothetical protein TREMPRED_001738 [Tremellales sp. Tagirdzhanova-0007]
MPKPTDSQALFDAVENRRSHYQLSNKSTLSDDQLVALVQRAVKHCPNAFNIQESRAVIVTGEQHRKLWEKVLETWKPTYNGDVDQEKAAEGQAARFAGGYGTILFYEDQEIINAMGEKMPYYAKSFPVWSDNSAGMLQFIVWTALAAEGMGASLQHHGSYSPQTQELATKMFDVPQSWKSTAMMPFGIPTGPPGNPGRPPKETMFAPIEPRVRTFFG